VKIRKLFDEGLCDLFYCVLVAETLSGLPRNATDKQCHEGKVSHEKMDAIIAMFPKTDKDIVESVFVANGGDVEATIGALLEINGEATNEIKRPSIQLQRDEEYARQLQEREMMQQRETPVEEKSPIVGTR
jgi:hypothetical protein